MIFCCLLFGKLDVELYDISSVISLLFSFIGNFIGFGKFMSWSVVANWAMIYLVDLSWLRERGVFFSVDFSWDTFKDWSWVLLNGKLGVSFSFFGVKNCPIMFLTLLCLHNLWTSITAHINFFSFSWSVGYKLFTFCRICSLSCFII